MGFNPLAALVAAIFCAGMGFGAGWKVRSWEAAADDERAKQTVRESIAAEQRRADRAAADHERERAAITARLEAARRQAGAALSAPLPCQAASAADGAPAADALPSSIGELVLPAGALSGVRAAAGAAAPDAPASEPRGSLP